MKGRDLLTIFFSLCAMLLSWPTLIIFNHPSLVLGISFLYLFVVSHPYFRHTFGSDFLDRGCEFIHNDFAVPVTSKKE